MLGALEFTAYPDVVPALEELRERGLVLVVASNWDCSLPDWLRPPGILELVDGVATSAEVGAAKPDPRVFERALAACWAWRPLRRCTWATRSTTTWRAPRRPACGACCSSARATPPAGVEAIRSLRELAALL